MACMQTLYSSRRLCLRETLNKSILTLLIRNVAPLPRGRGQVWSANACPVLDTGAGDFVVSSVER